MRLAFPTPACCRMPARVILEAGIHAVVPQGHKCVSPIGGSLNLGEPAAVLGTPGHAILGQPITQVRSALPPDRVGSLSPEFARRQRDQVTRRGRARSVSDVEHTFYYRSVARVGKQATSPPRSAAAGPRSRSWSAHRYGIDEHMFGILRSGRTGTLPLHSSWPQGPGPEVRLLLPRAIACNEAA